MTPTGKMLGTFEPHSAEWWAVRQGRIGGSDIAVACGWSPWKERAELLKEKASRELHPLSTPSTPAQERGNMLEAAGLAWLAHRKGLDYYPAASAATWVHPEHDWAMFTPDGVTTGDELVEIKTTTDRHTNKGWGRAGTDKVPLYYAAQVQWGLGVIGLPSAWLAVIHGATNGRPDLDMAVYRIAFNPAVFERLLKRAELFIDELHERTNA